MPMNDTGYDAATWEATDMVQDGGPLWLLRMFEKSAAALRAGGVGAPSVYSQGYIVLDVPTLIDQARALNKRDDEAPQVFNAIRAYMPLP